MTKPAEALVIGGGPAGAVLATALAEAGRAVRLFERRAEPSHKVCGEFLSAGALCDLAALGLDLEALGAVPIEAVRLAVRSRVVEAPLPFAAMSLSRRALDEALLQRAAAAGADIRRGQVVRQVTDQDGVWQARLASGETVSAGAVFLATGKHDLRGWQRPPGRQTDLIGFKQHWRLSPSEKAALGRVVELALFDGGYLGLEPVEDGRANLCLLIRRRRMARLGYGWPDLLAAIRAESPLLDRRLRGAAPCWDRPLAIAAIPFGYVWRGGGPWRLGDQAAVVPSFTGDGLAVAVRSARLAARLFLDGATSADFHRRLAADASGIVGPGTLLSHALVRASAQRIVGAAVAAAPGLVTWYAGASRLRPGTFEGNAAFPP